MSLYVCKCPSCGEQISSELKEVRCACGKEFRVIWPAWEGKK